MKVTKFEKCKGKGKGKGKGGDWRRVPSAIVFLSPVSARFPSLSGEKREVSMLPHPSEFHNFVLEYLPNFRAHFFAIGEYL